MHAGQAQVEDQQVEFMRGQRGVGLAARTHLVDRIPRGAQRAQQAIGQHLVVFGNEDPHRVVSLGWGLPSRVQPEAARFF